MPRSVFEAYFYLFIFFFLKREEKQKGKTTNHDNPINPNFLKLFSFTSGYGLHSHDFFKGLSNHFSQHSRSVTEVTLSRISGED